MHGGTLVVFPSSKHVNQLYRHDLQQLTKCGEENKNLQKNYPLLFFLVMFSLLVVLTTTILHLVQGMVG